MALIKKFTPQNSDQFLGKDQGDHSLAKFGHLNYLLRQINSSLLSFTPGSILFSDANGDPAGDPTQLNWDDTNNRLGIGVAAPTKTIDALGTFLLTGTNSAANTDSLYLGGSFTFKDPYPRSSLATGTAMGNNINAQYIFRNESNGTTKEMSLGSMFQAYYAHSGPIGNTAWGNNNAWTQRRAAHLTHAINVPQGTYNFNGNFDYPTSALWIQQNLGSSDGIGPLVINTGSSSPGGISAVNVKFDTWPDSGGFVRTYTGWLNMYTGGFDVRGATGSTIQRLNFFAAGYLRYAVGSTTTADVMGYYCQSMKNASITNAWAFYQDGASDKNHFAGNTLIGTTTDAGYKLDVNGTARINNVIFSSNANQRIIEYNNASGLTFQNTAGPLYMNATMTINRTGDVQIYNNFSALRYISFSGSYKINTNDGYSNLFGLNIGADGTRVMQIFNGGNVGFEKGIDYNSTNNASALVSINSTTQGFLPPRMTGAQAEAIPSPAEGLMVYATAAGSGAITSKGWWGYDGATWVKLN